MDEDDLYSNVLKERDNYHHVHWRFPPDRPPGLKHHTAKPFSGKRLGKSQKTVHSGRGDKVPIKFNQGVSWGWEKEKIVMIRQKRALPLKKVFRPRRKKTNLLKERM